MPADAKPGWRTRLRAWDAERRRRGRGDLTYPQWIERYDTVDAGAMAALRERAQRLASTPLISVLMPVYDPRPQWLREALDSVRAQVYEHWQLCIADDLSTDPAVRAVLTEYAERDSRIRVVFRETNGHISAASNSALALAEGEFVALLDHDDLLPPHALLCVAETIIRFPNAAVVYSDEDKIDEHGQRCAPYFKCDWNPELFRCYNMISHLGAYRTALMRSVGGFREGYEGAQDYDLALRCVETVPAEQVLHIPHVLYHWRIHGDSTSAGNATKPYALDAGRRALQDHLMRNGLQADVIAHAAGWYQVDYRVPQPAPTATAILIDDGDTAALRRCVDSVLRHGDYARWDVLIASRRGRDVAELQSSQVPVRALALREAHSPVALRNAAAREASGEILVFLDSRCEIVDVDWLGKSISFAARPGTGAVAPKLVSDDGRIVGGGVLLGLCGALGLLGRGAKADEIGYYGRTLLSQNLSALGEGCIAISRSAFDLAGAYPQDYRGAQAATVALCLQLHAGGMRNAWVPSLQVRSRDPGRLAAWLRRPARDDLARLRAAWPDLFRRDPAYNPNLSLARENFSLANPPRIDIRKPWFDP